MRNNLGKLLIAAISHYTMNKFRQITLAVASVALAISARALPTPGLSISETGYTTVNIPIDVTGQADFSGSFGTWLINLDSGESFPSLGTSTSPALDLEYKGSTQVVGSSLTISFTDTFGPFAASTLSDLIAGNGGNADIAVSIYEGATLLGSYTGGSTIEENNLLNVVAATQTNLTIDVTLTDLLTKHSKSGATAIETGDINETYNTVPDQGMTALLLGLGLTALGLVAWKRSKLQVSA